MISAPIIRFHWEPKKCELGNNNNNNSNDNSNGNGKAHNEVSAVSADHSKRTTRGKDDSDIKKGKSQHLCWFQKCNKLSGFESLSELNFHIRNISSTIYGNSLCCNRLIRTKSPTILGGEGEIKTQ